jgi:hypothetical protein
MSKYQYTTMEQVARTADFAVRAFSVAIIATVPYSMGNSRSCGDRSGANGGSSAGLGAGFSKGYAQLNSSTFDSRLFDLSEPDSPLRSE